MSFLSYQMTLSFQPGYLFDDDNDSSFGCVPG